MDKQGRRSGIVLASVLAIAGAVAAGARVGSRVLYHGAVVSSQVRTVDGQPFVPLADMARVLGGKVAAHGADGYEIVTSGGGPAAVAAGGANEVRGQNGKVGDWFFNGYWRFQVKSVERMGEYHTRFQGAGRSDRPDGDNDELVVITCQIKNGNKQSEEPILAVNGLNNQKTALTDNQGQSFAPRDFDSRNGALAPGAGKTFAIVFSVPKGTAIQSLIFTMYGYGLTSNKASDVRVALGP